MKVLDYPLAALDSGMTLLGATGAGATSRASIASLRWGISPRDTPYLAVGDGSTDDTAAIQAAMNAAAAAKLPLIFNDGYTYIVDGLAPLSNCVMLGDFNTTIKLKNSATGVMFAWPNSTISNFVMDGLILDGNLLNQSAGAPSSLVHSVFLGGSSAFINNSSFTRLVINNAAGAVFGASALPAAPTFTDCVFRDILINNHYQDAFTCAVATCIFSGWRIYNATNTHVRNNCFGMAPILSTKSVYRDFYITMSTSNPNTQDWCGFALTGDYNVVDNIDVDAGNTAHNFCFTLDTGIGNQCAHLISRNGNWNCDFEIFAQTDMQGVNFNSANVRANCVGMIFDGCTRTKVKNYNFKGNGATTDAVRFNNGQRGNNNDVTLDGYSIDGSVSPGASFEGLRVIGASSNIKCLNGYIKGMPATAFNNYGIYVDGTGVLDGFVVDGLTVDPVGTPWHLDNVRNASLRNITILNPTNATFEQTDICQNIHYENLVGVNFARQSSNTKGLSCRYGSRLVKSTYSFATHGGTIGTKTFDPQIPAGSMITRAFFYTEITPSSAANTATISFGLSGVSNTVLAAAANANATYISGNTTFGAIKGDNPAAFVQTATSTPMQVTMTIGTQALTAGFIDIFIEYDQGLL